MRPIESGGKHRHAGVTCLLPVKFLAVDPETVYCGGQFSLVVSGDTYDHRRGPVEDRNLKLFELQHVTSSAAVLDLYGD